MVNASANNWYEGLRVFVYGTLKPGGHYWPQFCEGKVVGWSEARVKGRIYDLPVGYPAVSFEGEGWVQGVVLSLKDVSGLKGLDRLEGFDPLRPRANRNEYIRKKVHAWLVEEERIERVWGYEMSLERISRHGGRFLEEGVWPS